jgi:hypothetical protein
VFCKTFCLSSRSTISQSSLGKEVLPSQSSITTELVFDHVESDDGAGSAANCLCRVLLGVWMIDALMAAQKTQTSEGPQARLTTRLRTVVSSRCSSAICFRHHQLTVWIMSCTQCCACSISHALGSGNGVGFSAGHWSTVMGMRVRYT